MIWSDTKKALCLFLLTSTLVSAQLDSASGQSEVQQAKHVFSVTEKIESPLRLAIDRQDIVYVTDAVGGRICSFDSAGNFLEEFASAHSPLAIAVTPQNRLYIGDRVSGELQLLDRGGQLLKKIADGTRVFGLPSSAILDDENRLYVVDSKEQIVRIFDANGHDIGTIGKDILGFPTGIAFDQKNQRILIAEHGGVALSDSTRTGGMIHVFDKQGNSLASFGEYGHNIGQFSRIQGLAVDRLGRIFAADSYQGTITVLDEKGTFLASIGEYGRKPGQLRAPMDVAVDSRNRLWIASMNNSSLEVYDIGDIATDVKTDYAPAVPVSSELLQNYPNPFNPGTWIPYVLEKDSPVVIHIYNEVGKRIRTFDLGIVRRGSYKAEGKAVFWNGKNSKGEAAASGIYFYKIRAGDFVAGRRMVLLK